jgi:transcriptional regulator with XRE-family HTH domain
MLSQTLSSGLDRYRIGPKIRDLRLAKKLGLVQLGKHTGLSPALISKIERGQLFPTLPTLLRIALVFGVGLEHFFAEAPRRPAVTVVRKADRIRLPDSAEGEPSWFFESLDFPIENRKMEAFYAEFPTHAKPSAPHKHRGAELIYVIRGQLSVSVDGDETILGEGDAMHVPGGVEHSYRRKGKTSSSAIVVVASE